MAPQAAYKLIDNVIEVKQKKTGFAFFGGEPLLHKDLIKNIVQYARKISQDTDTKFYFKITTNGLLLDEEFVKYCKAENIFIAISLDGIPKAHDAHRIDKNGIGTYEKILKAAKLLISVAFFDCLERFFDCRYPFRFGFFICRGKFQFLFYGEIREEILYARPVEKHSLVYKTRRKYQVEHFRGFVVPGVFAL